MYWRNTMLYVERVEERDVKNWNKRLSTVYLPDYAAGTRKVGGSWGEGSVYK